MTGQAIEGRFWVRLISPEALQQYMQHRGQSVRTLAQQVDRETAREALKTGIGQGTSSRSIIGHLRKGTRKTCQPATARAIEKCLGAPPSSLFVPQVSHVYRDNKAVA